jgi:hypothetical protein
MDTVDELVELNNEMASRETAGDGAWFDRLLAPEFAMRRASGVYAGRAAFLAAVAPSAERTTSDVDVVHHTDRTAVVVCVVSMRQSDGSVQDFRNCRLFGRPDAAASWQLLGWANEPV